MTPERTQQLLDHARQSLTTWHDTPPHLRADAPPYNLIPCEEAIELLETFASVSRILALLNADEAEDEVRVAQGIPVEPVAPKKPMGRPVGSKNKPKADPELELGYETLASLYRLETNPIIKANYKKRLEAIRARETAEMIAEAAKPPVREFKPFGTHNRFQG